MANDIERPQPPALPYAEKEYMPTALNQYSNILRLFFNRLTSMFSHLFSINEGGKFLYFPKGYAYSSTDQSAASINTGYAVQFENTTVNKGFSVAGGSNTQLTVVDPGFYNFQIMLQASEAGGADVDVTVYTKLNGTSIVYGGQIQTVPASGEQIIPLNFSIALTAGQYIEIYWATTSTNVTLNATATAGVHVGLASATASVSFVSNA